MTTEIVLYGIIGILSLLLGGGAIIVMLYIGQQVSKLDPMITKITDLEAYIHEIADAPDVTEKNDITMIGASGEQFGLTESLSKLLTNPKSITTEQRDVMAGLLEQFLEQLKADTSKFDFDADDDEEED